jgi:uncharacterized protein YbgA (DUF1722 family)/uncharacterized protein YbbK (DUF523 family)
MSEKIRIGISSCLLGEKVRYDGGHKRDRYLSTTLSEYFEYVPVCPEFECGLGVPRESMRLVGSPESPRLQGTRSGTDFTERMETWAWNRVRELESERLCGFVFKSNSPSSGMERVKVYGASGMPTKTGVGVFARIFMEQFPLLPTEEEGRLHDPVLRENFIQRVFALQAWRDQVASSPTPKALSDFQARNKLLVMSHSQEAARQLGRMAARGGNGDFAATVGEYEHAFLAALRLHGTLRKNTNVLQHAMGHFKKLLTADEKAELVELIGHYRDGLVPLVVPVTMIAHYARKYQNEYLLQQTYLHPHPLELRLRNHA